MPESDSFSNATNRMTTKEPKDQEPFLELETAVEFGHGEDLEIQEFVPDDLLSSGQGSEQIEETEMRDIDNANDGTENLVRSEARAVCFLRGALIVLLVAATLLTGMVTHSRAVRGQIESFERDFQTLATQFSVKFKDGIENYLYQSTTLSQAIGAGIFAGGKPNFPDVTLANLDGLVASLRLQERALTIVWSPLLTTKSDRDRWQKYAISEYQTLNQSSLGQYQPCYMCGEGNEIADPTRHFQVPGYGDVICETAQENALQGVLSPNLCSASMVAMPSLCGCRKSNGTSLRKANTLWKVSDGMFRIQNGTAVHDNGPAPFSPVWQISPSSQGENTIMFNQMSDPRRRKAISAMIKYKMPVLSESFDARTNAFYNRMQGPFTEFGIIGVLFYPVFESAQSFDIAGSLAVDFSWKSLIELGLTDQSDGTLIVLENACGQIYTFKVDGKNVELIGEGDYHDKKFDSLVVQSSVDEILALLSWISPNEGFRNVSSSWGCSYSMRVYPTQHMRSKYLTFKPWIETIVVISIFTFTSLVFWLYDFILRRIQAKVMNSAKRSEAIVFSLFPAVVRDRLYEDRGEGRESQSLTQPTSIGTKTQRRPSLLHRKIRLKTFLAQPTSEDVTRESEPIADLFPNTTILFADIAGFTAWSSEREPAQVFTLLESIYGAFDVVANKLGVFKIETIGDCYVAVAGLPEPRQDHAVVMAKFAFECLVKMSELTKKLESLLGPGTADLAIRVGLHSGPVTGGVLRGERARFQLFGDTMNTASRMESNGKVNHIHASKETAQLLIQAGKSAWVEERSEMILVKGKGELQTYWVNVSRPMRQQKMALAERTNPSGIAPSSVEHNSKTPWGATSLYASLAPNPSSNRHDRLIAWTVDLLEQFIQKIVARRIATDKCVAAQPLQCASLESQHTADTHVAIINEITEVIAMPKFEPEIVNVEMDPARVDIGSNVRSQLRSYVAQIAGFYHDNAFHNFEHASHVVMSASKLLKRIIAPDDVDYRADKSGTTLKSNTVLSKEIHDTSYGISSDPLMQFAVVFSALIHDVDHRGLQNRQLVKQQDPLAISYHGKCVAEQHSVRCAWHTLMEDQYADLRHCIYQTDDDRARFRQLVINAVLATDIADKELQTWRQNRWDKAFYELEDRTTMDRKATLLFEYILQASDVAPTMQHWHVYQKWNQLLFEERYTAYVLGNDEEDPSQSWYEGELSFFDHYVIPLARNLDESHVFGVSCNDYFAYALENRREWEVKGREIVSEMVKSQKSLIAKLGP